jgi:hypothetical protein
MPKGLILSIFTLIGIAATALAAGPTTTPVASPTTTPSPTQQRCCFCVYPDKGQVDSDLFAAQCDRCATTAYQGACDVYSSWSKSAYTDRAIQPLNCGSVDLVNLQHGPTTAPAVSEIKVCQSAFPGCPVKLNDLSCATYYKRSEAQAAIKEIQTALFGRAKVSLCGSRSVNILNGECSYSRSVEHWVISATNAKEELGLCPEFGEPCSFQRDGQGVFSCLDTLGRQKKIQCCSRAGGAAGYWGDQNGCSGRGCDAQRCPLVQSCSGDAGYSTQRCVGDPETGFCHKTWTPCDAGTRCKMLADVNVPLCVLRGTPTAIQTASPPASRR